MTTQHTPTPWTLHPQRTNARIWTSGYDAYTSYLPILLPYKTEKDKANAAFIVQACNAHDLLLEAAKEADSWLGQCDEGTHQHDISLNLRAAIAKAEGK